MIWCDNILTLSLSSNPLFHARTKHIEIDYHFVREKVINKDLAVSFVPSEDQLADIFTKSLSSNRFLTLKTKLMVISPPISLQGSNRQTSP